MSRFENIDLMNRELEECKQALQQIKNRGLLNDQTGQMLYYLFQDPDLIVFRMYPEAKAELIFKTANYLKTILEEDNIDREDNLNFRTPLDIEQLQLPVRAKNFLQSLKIFSWGDLLLLNIHKEGSQMYLGNKEIGRKTLDDIKQYVKEKTGQELKTVE